MAQSDSDSTDSDEECLLCFVDLLKQTGEPPIFDCGQGHMLCQICFMSLQKSDPSHSPVCPTCKTPIENRRNRSLERVRDRRLKKVKALKLLALQGPDPETQSEADKGAGANKEEAGEDFPPADIVEEGRKVQGDEQGEEKVAAEPEEANEPQQLPKGGKKADKKKKKEKKKTTAKPLMVRM